MDEDAHLYTFVPGKWPKRDVLGKATLRRASTMEAPMAMASPISTPANITPRSAALKTIQSSLLTCASRNGASALPQHNSSDTLHSLEMRPCMQCRFQGLAETKKLDSNLPEEEPLIVSKQANNGSNDDCALCIAGHVFEDWGQHQQRDHDQQPCNDSRSDALL